MLVCVHGRVCVWCSWVCACMCVTFNVRKSKRKKEIVSGREKARVSECVRERERERERVRA